MKEHMILKRQIADWNAEIARLQTLVTHATGLPQEPNWKAFALAVLRQSRDGTDIGDVDGGVIQDEALKHGLLTERQSTEIGGGIYSAMNDLSASERIRALEDSLGNCIAYLRRMPLVPMTYDLIKESQVVLDDRIPAEPMVGELYTPAGIMVIGIRIEGRQAMVRTNVSPGDGERFLEGLTRGFTVQLKIENE